MDAAVHRTHRIFGVVAFQAEVHTLGLLLCPGHIQGVVDELVNALIPGGGDGDHGDTQDLLQLVDTHGAAVGPDLVHHVQGQDHGDLQLHQLHGQIKVALDVGGIHNVDDTAGAVVHQKVPGDDLLIGVGGQGINARQVRHRCLRVIADGAVLPVHGDTGEIAHVLIGTGELVEEGGLAAVLVACQGKGQLSLFQMYLFALLLAHAGVGNGLNSGLPAMDGHRVCMDIPDLDPLGFLQPQCQLIAPQGDLHGVAHGGHLLQHHLGLGRQAHVQQMVPQGSIPAHRRDKGGLAGLQFIHRHRVSPHSIAFSPL